MLETVLTLTIFEIKLLIRDKAVWPRLLGLPIVGGIVFGLIGRTTPEPILTYGLFLFMIIGAIVLAGERDLGTRIGDFAPCAGKLFYISRMLASFLVLTIQSLLYVSTAAIFSAGSVPGFGSYIAALLLSLIIKVSYHRTLQSR